MFWDNLFVLGSWFFACLAFRGSARNVLWAPGRHWQSIFFVDKSDRLLGWKSETPWKDGLRKTIEWYGGSLQLLQYQAQ
tara:strand:+ start:1025 stop:1261 length:237 start_codon:yes stop_codon:yes gene_type:complete